MADEDEPIGEEGRPSEPPPGEDEDEHRRRRRLERLLRETLRRGLERGMEAGLGTISRSGEALRGITGGELPRELVNYVFSQVDDTKNALVRVVAREVRDFLEATDIATELQKALTSLSFEVKTEIRFVPNEAGGVRPSVRTRSAGRHHGDDDDPPDDDDDDPPGQH